MNYSVVVFDCDGVILDSNHIKTAAMAEVVCRYGEDLSQQFIHYHRENGGISRYLKFDYFLREIVGQYSANEYDQLLSDFSTIVKQRLLQAPFTDGALTFIKHAHKNAKLYVVSGGDQEEICETFDKRDMTRYFSEIFGSPVEKNIHCKNISHKAGVGAEVLFIGDSRLDHQVASDNGFDFIFLNRYTDFDDWREYCNTHNIKYFPDFSALMDAQLL